MLKTSTLKLLRFHFSLFLLPVFLFALSQVESINWANAILSFFVLHLLVYPASNGYNSYMDRDEGPIGGLENPPTATKELFFTTVLMDAIAVCVSIFINPFFATGILIYILASRAYSYRGIRLKKYPVIGFMTVFICQGALIFLISVIAIGNYQWDDVNYLPCIISSLLIGALYPLTQIYQHDADRKDGVTTISMILGKKGSFVFSMLLFLSATAAMYVYLPETKRSQFYLFLIFMAPTVLYFLFWMMRVSKNPAKADFKQSLRMNIVSTVCTMSFFITLIIQNH